MSLNIVGKYFEARDEIEEVEKIRIQDTKLQRCCTASLELVKAVLAEDGLMSENQKESNEGGFHLNTDGLNCLPCKCRKQTFHKEIKINNEGKTVIEDRTS